ncbi:prolipoprotein diacylglyceryl transferase [Sphingobacterium sp. HJSM2_6]|uniref:prolipoprotein diacylglyceryl transferase n=1 Tax=Sphingobacterium sp. HJSM2_6 TaxID=3366264 RepID=UPI003BE64CD8
MFPTIGHFINHFFGTSFELPIPTFGFFVALAFFFSFLVFRSEFKRKEKNGEISAFIPSSVATWKHNLFLVVGFGILAFLIGFKGYALILQPQFMVRDPFDLLFSMEGHWTMGIIMSLLTVVIVVIIISRKSKQTTVIDPIRPYQLTPLMLLCCAIAGFLGAKLFNIVEDWGMLQTYGFFEMLKRSGLTFYGGLVFGAIAYFIIGIRYGISWKPLVDIGAMGMLVAYSVGRMGCHFSGDGDWGIVNMNPKPFSWLPDSLWASYFPHNVIEQGVQIAGCSGKYCMVLTDPVFPTSAYEVIIIGLAFIILWLFRNRFKTAGLVACIYFFIIAIERFLIEMIRVNYKFDVLGIPLSEAQIISVFIGIIAIVLAIYLRKTNLKPMK